MDITAWPRTAILAAFQVRVIDCSEESRGQTLNLNSLRSVGNIREWRTYLPEDCVNTMIKMRWDQTT